MNNNFEISEEQLVIHSFVEPKGNSVTVEARAIGEFEFNGKMYRFDRVIKFRAKRVPNWRKGEEP